MGSVKHQGRSVGGVGSPDTSCADGGGPGDSGRWPSDTLPRSRGDVLRSVRDVPQASTGFSPFELLFGRKPRGVLELIKENWEEGPSAGKSEIQYVLDLRAKLHTLDRMSRKNLLQAQERQQRLYNRDNSHREKRTGGCLAEYNTGPVTHSYVAGIHTGGYLVKASFSMCLAKDKTLVGTHILSQEGSGGAPPENVKASNT
ncbi:uncharacterized protein LOC116399190 [Anarrhichthys ocellatus]|uniref:uncharacterized protein LOC116399190 n=1 Tax=Anarrhichthys ocellatus TaxID=433405 RepID=UPI0012ED7030|nr:uncharacterized protein LOC116399190 [Anarrhichthys ocellatus]